MVNKYVCNECSLIPNFCDIDFHIAETNSDPLSDVHQELKPCLETHEWSKASAQAEVDASVMGIASTYLVDLQITISRYL